MPSASAESEQGSRAHNFPLSFRSSRTKLCPTPPGHRAGGRRSSPSACLPALRAPKVPMEQARCPLASLSLADGMRVKKPPLFFPPQSVPLESSSPRRRREVGSRKGERTVRAETPRKFRAGAERAAVCLWGAPSPSCFWVAWRQARRRARLATGRGQAAGGRAGVPASAPAVQRTAPAPLACLWLRQ